MEFIHVLDLKKKIEGGEPMTIIDIRESYELDICKIDALHIPMGEIGERIEELPTDKTIMVLCRSGKRAEAVANLLKSDHGITDVKVIEGGILAWIDQVDNQLEAY